VPGTTDRNFALLSTRRSAGEVEVSVGEVELPHWVDPDDVVVRMLAAPINPSDIGSMLGPADPGTARQTPAGAVLQVPDPSEVDPATLGCAVRSGWREPAGSSPPDPAGRLRTCSAGVVSLIGSGTFARYVRVRRATGEKYLLDFDEGNDDDQLVR